MEQELRAEDQRMSPAEAEEVLRRFREEEEVRQKEMEARATHPTVADLAEGLGVSTERVSALLAQVRGVDPEPQAFRSNPINANNAQLEVQRANRMAWIIAGLIFGVVFILGLLAVVFSTATTISATPEPPISVPLPDTETAAPTPDATGP